MSIQKNINGFFENTKPDEYEARFSVSGEVRMNIKASSLEEAKKKAEAMLDDEEFGIELDEVSDASVDYVWKTKPMFLVNRGGKKMQVSLLLSGDQPREPDERGF